jgi:hypothetical protein
VRSPQHDTARRGTNKYNHVLPIKRPDRPKVANPGPVHGAGNTVSGCFHRVPHHFQPNTVPDIFTGFPDVLRGVLPDALPDFPHDFVKFVRTGSHNLKSEP